MYSENLLSKKMRTFAEKNEWLISGEYIYGDEQGYLFSGMESKGQKTFITPVPGIEEEQVKELFSALDRNSSTMKLKEYDITDDFLCIRIKDSSGLRSEDIEFILALLVGILQDLTIVTAGRCQECGKLGAENEDFLYDLYCYMHTDCAERIKDADDSGKEAGTDAGSDMEEPEAESGITEEAITVSVPRWKKILFTLGGAVLGSIPWLIMPYVMDILLDLLARIGAPTILDNFVQSLVTCLCAYFVSYFAITGYRLSRARMDGRGRWIVGIVSIAVVILVQFAYLAVLIIKEPDVALNFKNFITNLIKYNFYINMILGAGIGIVFTLISVLPFFDSSKKSARSKNDFLKHRKISDDEDILDEDIRDDETIQAEVSASRNGNPAVIDTDTTESAADGLDDDTDPDDDDDDEADLLTKDPESEDK
ncbi:MAG: hypothetical protein ACYCYM_00520 [Saccharofermentanales bacterium]